MNPIQFEKSKKPFCFMMSIDPVTGEYNFEYLEGWNWGAYFRSIKEDFPGRFHYFTRNRVAKKIYMSEVWGLK